VEGTFGRRHEGDENDVFQSSDEENGDPSKARKAQRYKNIY